MRRFFSPPVMVNPQASKAKGERVARPDVHLALDGAKWRVKEYPGSLMRTS